MPLIQDDPIYPKLAKPSSSRVLAKVLDEKLSMRLPKLEPSQSISSDVLNKSWKRLETSPKTLTTV
ncbi:uncharacterized protein A1O9_04650 [Exophiala aquamarina CBS 119918]|uniref:Uncharacterized protein n=1 Tax=Exophiala aquamarina CBS 119918 TaxID=1182545 RepID=A0A072PJA9_9EURO|nr:uncharacterized protein A1O9_04650 [Exophiala aquamarina CBS 119918]KEF59802.1 hypothetical protein A1O9_04650 [Exophiala aquamarina CBS 119918]